MFVHDVLDFRMPALADPGGAGAAERDDGLLRGMKNACSGAQRSTAVDRCRHQRSTASEKNGRFLVVPRVVLHRPRPFSAPGFAAAAACSARSARFLLFRAVLSAEDRTGGIPSAL